MFSFASIRPRLAEWRGWLPLAALPIFMFIALIALGGDRGYFYRDAGIHDSNTRKTLAIAENLSPKHNFRLAFSVSLNEDGGFRYDLYSRFPVGGYALVKLATLPFGSDLANKLLAARVLMLMMFCGAATFAHLAIARAVGSRWVAFAAAALAFSGFYAVYYADGVFNEGVMDLFGAALVFHGMVVFVQDGRFPQLAAKTCAALLLGWHVYALILPFTVLGFGGEALALIRSAASSGEKAVMPCARSAISSLIRSRYAALAAVAILFGFAPLAFNLANEYADFAGETEFARPQLVDALTRRFGLTDDYGELGGLEWDNFTRRQLYRAGVASAPYALARAVGWDIPAREPSAPPLAPAVLGAAAAVAALAASALAPRCRIPLAAAALFGFCWAIPMRYNTFMANHAFESLPYVFLTLTLFALALTGARRLPVGRLRERVGGRIAFAVCAAAAGVFAMSVFRAGRLDRDDAEAERDKSLMADFSAIGAMTRGKRVIAFPRHFYTTLDYVRKNHYLAGSYWSASADVCDPRAADFIVSRYRRESLNLLAPENRFAFLYEDTAPLDLCRAERRRLEASEPAARAAFDVYLQDGALGYLKASCEPNDYDAPLFAYIYPADPDVLPAEHRRNGFQAAYWGGETFTRFGATFDGACIATLHLPDYPIAAIRTGQAEPGGETLWDVFATPPLDAEALAFYESAYQDIAASGEPAARAGFDLYLNLDRNTLSYLKAPCGEDDARGRFFLSVHPANIADLPADRRAIGHESLNFDFAPPAGVAFDGKCMATRRLPDYDIARIETGQWTPGGERVWAAEVVVGD